MSESHRKIGRERFLAVVLLALVLIFAARLVQLQVFQHARWHAIAKAQSQLTKYEKPTRGSILDRNGLPLAVTLPLTYAVGYRPIYILNFDATASLLASQLGKPKNELREKFESTGFVYLARRVDWEVKEKIEALGLTFLQFDEEPRRSYPAGTTAAAVLGFADRDNKGMEGVEASMNDELSGEGSRELFIIDALRKTPIPVSPIPVELRGADVTLTIDLQLQSIVEDKLRMGLAGHQYERACAVMVDPRSGDILAMTTLPTFDPNSPGDFKPQNRRCWPVTDVIEPGSVLKIVPIAKALETHAVQRDTRIFCENGHYKVPGKVIKDTHSHGYLTVDEVLAYSSNIGAAKISQRFSPSDFYDKLRAFGFGNPTLINLPGEQAGEVPPPSRWTGPTQANLAFGQGISCTPMQLVMAYASIANGGLLMKPRLVKCADFPTGVHTDYKAESVRPAVTDVVAEELKQMLVGVVEYGTGATVKTDGVRIAGKTGTASKVDHEHRRYFSDRYVSSFVGFFPADNPRYVLLVMVDDPRGVYYGASIAGPIFHDIVAEMITVRPAEVAPMPSRASQMAVNLATVSRETAVNASQLDQAPVALASLSVPVSATLADSSLVIVPMVEGLTIRSAMQELSRRGLSFRLTGTRTVISQSPPAGTVVRTGTTCELIGVIG